MSLHLKPRRDSRRNNNEHGYALLTLLLILAMLAIFATALVPTIKFTMQRDREEEMIHRGTQYSRAIRAYYKKFGRYPVKLEDLESTNNLRFLRKRYKDPLTGKDFKLLHFGEVQMMSSMGMGGGAIPGATPVSAMGGSNTSPGGSGGAFGQSSSFGQSSGFGQSGQSSFGQSSGFGQSSSFGGNSSFGNSSFGNNSSGTQSNQSGNQNGNQTTTDSTDSSTQAPGTPGTNGDAAEQQPGQIIGGPIVGVASTSKDTTIREFNHKKKYKDWAFVYDPMQDQGRLITTPYQPQLATFAQNGQPAGSTPNSNSPNGNNSSSGFSSGFNSGTFGSSPNGTQNTPNSSPSGYGNSNPPSNSPQQQ
jgi:type II secretory pathway pseudopilin PulG